MTTSPRPPEAVTRTAALFVSIVALLALGSCTATDSTSVAPGGSLAFSPSFQVEPDDFDALPIDRIRLTARDAESAEIVGSSEEDVSPEATTWSLSLPIDLGGSSAREVLVDVELLGGVSVQWSGRLGPVSVSASVFGPPVHPVPVFRGPLDNLEVDTVFIDTAPVQLLVGQTGTATATVQLVSGSTAEPEVFWVSLADSVATVDVDSAGVATITAVSPGTATIAAGAGPAIDETEVVVLPAVDRVEVEPASATIFGIGATTQLTATVFDGFGVEAPAEMVVWSSADTLIATVDAAGLVTGVAFGTAAITATSNGVSGSATVGVTGPDLAITSFALTPDQGEDVGDLEAVVFDFEVANRGGAPASPTTLGVRVLDAGDLSEAHPTLVFDVGTLASGGRVSFQVSATGQGQPVTLPAQVRFEAVADFLAEVVEEDETNNTATSGDFTTVLPQVTKTWVGGAVGDVSNWSNADNWLPVGIPAAFHDVVLAETSDSPVLTEDVTIGSLAMDYYALLDLGGFSLTVSGDIGGTDGGGISNGIVIADGPGALVQGYFDDLVVLQDAVLSGWTYTTGSLDVEADLTVGDLTLNVSGDFTTSGSGRLVMDAAAGQANFFTNATFDGGDQTGLLTAGTMSVGGDLLVPGTAGTEFVADGSHRVVLNGAGAQRLSFGLPVAAQPEQRFFDLHIQNTGGTVSLDSDIVVMGAFSNVAGSGLDGVDDVLWVGGSYADNSDGITIREVAIIGDLSSISSFINGDVTVYAPFTLPSGLYVGQGLTVLSDLTIGQTSLTVEGDMTVVGGGARLVMDDANAVVEVRGNLSFDDNDHTGWLTAGLLSVLGDFTVGGTVGTDFVASGSHSVFLIGTGVQTVTLANPGVTGHRFQNLYLNNVNGSVVFASDIAVMGTFQAQSDATVDGSDDVVAVGGSYSVGGGASIATVEIVGDLTAIDAVVASDVRVSATFNVPSDLTVNDLLLADADMVLAGNRVLVNGDFAVTGANAQLFMQNAGDTLDVVGNVDFSGGSHEGALTEGFLRLLGSFSASGNPSAFVGTGNHEVAFLSGGVQTVTLDNPGLTAQRFADLTIQNFSGEVSLSSTLVVTDTLDADDVAVSRNAAGAEAGAVLDVRGTALFSEVTSTGLPIEIRSPVPGPAHTMRLVTFQSMSPADIQLYLELPGGVNSPLDMTDMSFDSPNFTTGAYLQTERFGVSAEPFVVNLFNPFPAGVTPPGYIQGTNTQVVWP